MKKGLFINLTAILIMVIFSAQAVMAQSGWEMVYSETASSKTIKGFSFVPGANNDWQTGWAAQFDGTILKTTDGGDTWTAYTQSYSSQVWGISFVDENTGYICGLGGKIMKSTDGGVTWTLVFNTSGYAFNKIMFKDANNGVATGYPSDVYTSDGGTTWTDATGGTDYWGLDYADGDTYYAVKGFTGEVGRTTDNGQSWSSIHSTGFGLTVCVNFLDGNTGLVGGSDYKVQITTDGASSWTTKTVDSGNGDILAASWFDSDTVWVSGSGIYKSTDGGDNWTEDTTMTASGFANRELFVTEMNVVFVEADNLSTSEVQIWRKIGVPPVVADFVASDSLICAGSSVDFTDLSFGNIDSWSWEFEGGTPATSTDQNPTVTYSSTGTFDVKLVVTVGSYSDSLIKTDYIEVVELPAQADTPEGDEEICTSGSYNYTVAEVPDAQDYEWELDPAEAGSLEWSGTSALLETDDTWTGDFTLRVRASNVCGDGPWSDYFNGTVNLSPSVFNITGGGEFCTGSDGVEVGLDGSETGVTYELYLEGDPTGNTVDGTGNEISFGLQDVDGDYTVVASNTSCEMEMDGVAQVTELYPPEQPETPSGPDSVCNDETSDYQTGGSDDADSYAWTLSPDGAGTITGDGLTATVEWSSDFSGTATVSVAGVNDCGEGEPATMDVEVGAVPAPVISGENEVCDNTSEDYTTEDNDGSTYTWDVTGGNITDGQGTAAITIAWGEPGTGSITVTEVSAQGCTGTSDEFAVTIDNCTGIWEKNKEGQLVIYPNPAENTLNVEFKAKVSGNIQVSIVNLTGQKLMQKELDAAGGKQSLQFNISGLQQGLYIIKIQSGNEVVLTRQFVKR